MPNMTPACLASQKGSPRMSVGKASEASARGGRLEKELAMWPKDTSYFGHGPRRRGKEL
jgi:hypothetical protein